MAHRYKARARSDYALEFGQYQVAVAVGRYGLELASALVAHLLPGHYVGMVVEFGHYHLIARCEILSAVGLRHEIDTLGGAANEDYLL